jgi:hypothetical protein
MDQTDAPPSLSFPLPHPPLSNKLPRYKVSFCIVRFLEGFSYFFFEKNSEEKILKNVLRYF